MIKIKLKKKNMLMNDKKIIKICNNIKYLKKLNKEANKKSKITNPKINKRMKQRE